MTVDSMLLAPPAVSSRKKDFSQNTLLKLDNGRHQIVAADKPATSPPLGRPATALFLGVGQPQREGVHSPEIAEFNLNVRDPGPAETPCKRMARGGSSSSPEDQGALRSRTHFSPEQVEAMIQMFHVTRYPSRTQYEDLARDIETEEKAIKLWFQNRRAKLRKLPTSSTGDSPSPMAIFQKDCRPATGLRGSNQVKDEVPSKQHGKRSRKIAGSANTEYQTMMQVALSPDHPFCNLKLTRAGQSSRSPSPASGEDFSSGMNYEAIRINHEHMEMSFPVVNNDNNLPAAGKTTLGNAAKLSFSGSNIPQKPTSGPSSTSSSNGPSTSGTTDKKISPMSNRSADFSISKLIGIDDESHKAVDRKSPSPKSPDVPESPFAFSPWVAPPVAMPHMISTPAFLPMMPYMASSIYPMPYVHPAALSFYGNMGHVWHTPGHTV